MELLSDPNLWLSFAALTVLEIILGIDNVIFISIVSNRLPEAQRQMARNLGLTLALVLRIVLLFSISWLMQLTTPLIEIRDLALSARDLIFIGGGLFLLAKATMEIHATVEGPETHTVRPLTEATLWVVILQIVALDVVFSFDSILTALGLTSHLMVIIAAVVIAMICMLLGAKVIAEFVERHLSIKMLALAFLLVIGVVLIADGLHAHIPKAYIYSSLAFAMFVQVLVMWASARHAKVIGDAHAG